MVNFQQVYSIYRFQNLLSHEPLTRLTAQFIKA